MQGGSEQGEEHLHKIIPLDGGLDLVTPRLLTEPGRLVDCLNYECVDQVGYKKIDGFERYDGGPAPSVAAYWAITTTSNGSLGFSVEDEEILEVVYVVDSVTRSVLATVRSTYVTDNKWVVQFYPVCPDDVELATSATLTDIYAETPTTVTAGVAGGYIIVDKESALSGALGTATSTRSDIHALPGDVPAYGLQMYKDRMHAIADCQYIYVVYDHTVAVDATVSANAPFYIGNVFRNGAAGRQGIILDYRFLYGGFGALSSAGTLATSAVAKVLVRFTNEAALTNNTVLNIDKTTSTFSAPITYWKYISALTGTAATDDEPVWGGVIYRGLQEPGVRTDENDWDPADMGYEVAFKNGSSTIIPREFTNATTTAQLNGEIQTSEESVTQAQASYSQILQAYRNSALSFPGATTDGGGALDGSTPPGYSLETADATGVYMTQSGVIWGDGTACTFKDFGFAIPDDVLITGISVTSRNFYNTSAGANTIHFQTVKLQTPSGTSANFGSQLHTLNSSVDNTSAAAKPFTFGGANNKWGLTTLTPADVNSDTFTLTMTPSVGINGTAYLFWDQLTVTVHYYRPVGKLFFNDGTSTLEARLVRMHLAKGSWSDGTAEGVAHIYGLLSNGTRNYIKPDEDIRLTSAGAAIADVVSVRSSMLPSHTDIVATDRRVQMLTANYFLNPDWEAIYGCHGLGRAFSYDGTYFRKIYSAYDSELDKPRHLASYRNYLALGYESGNVLLSKVGESGPEPENFDPLQGAREFSFVDRVVGLTELVDTSLGVFCSQSINRIVLNPNASSASGLFYTSVISPNSGAIEYTVSAFGNMTLLCDQHGIRSVEQTDVYGDFVGRPVSFPISPWLRSRLSSKKYWEDGNIASRPLFAHTVRSKNQYRVWFDDGYVLCMNMNTTEEPPRFTFLRYGFNFGATSFVPLCPVASTQSNDTAGAERIHLAHWNRLSTSTGIENNPDLFKYVFELERGWSFDGQDFPALLTLNLSFLETPFDYDQIRKIELHALDYNNTTLFAAFGTKYGEEKSYSGMAFSSTYVPAGRNAVGVLPTDYIPFSKMINLGNRGRPLYLKFKNATTATGDTSASAIEPPHILQALLVQYTPARQET